jgi:acid phosphatase
MPVPVGQYRWSAPLAAAATVVVIALGVPSACAAEQPPRAAAAPTPGVVSPRQAVPRPDHVVVVVEENEDASAIVGSADAPYLTSLAGQGANFTDAHAETHPSQPNYLALFSGDQQGVTDDRCLAPIPAPNLGSELLAAGKSFVGYSEDLPQAGFTGCRSGRYAQKHSPWAAFSTVPAAANQPWTAWPADFGQLPDLAMVTPNLCNDMHDCGVAAGDRWLKDNLAGYANWALTHNSWLIVTWDEASGSAPDNSIATMIVGAGIRPGPVSDRIDHYSLLRTISDAFGVRPLGRSAAADPITGIWS